MQKNYFNEEFQLKAQKTINELEKFFLELMDDNKVLFQNDYQKIFVHKAKNIEGNEYLILNKDLKTSVVDVHLMNEKNCFYAEEDDLSTMIANSYFENDFNKLYDGWVMRFLSNQELSKVNKNRINLVNEISNINNPQELEDFEKKNPNDFLKDVLKLDFIKEKFDSIKYSVINVYLEKIKKENKNKNEVTSIVADIFSLYKFLNREFNYNIKYTEDEYIGYNVINNKIYQKISSGWFDTISKIKEIAIKNKFILEKPFEYNDLDNLIFMVDDFVIIKSNNEVFAFNGNDRGNFKIYYKLEEFINVEEANNLVNKIRNKDINYFNDVFLDVQDNEVKYVSSMGAYLWKLDLDFGFEALDKKGYVVIEDKDIETTYSYNNLRNNVCGTYNINEIEFLCRVFIGLGNGFDYDEKIKGFKYRGSLTSDNKNPPLYDEEKYYENIFIMSIDKKKISVDGLTDEWREGGLKLLKYLEKHKENIKNEVVDFFNKLIEQNPNSELYKEELIEKQLESIDVAMKNLRILKPKKEYKKILNKL